MLRDAGSAVEHLPQASPWRPAALLAQGAALAVLGRDEQADEVLAAARDLAVRAGLVETEVMALGERVLVAAELGDHATADELDAEIQRLLETTDVDGPTRAIAHTSHARMLLRHGRWNEARTAVTAAREASARLTDALPWLALQVRLELARALVTLRDADAAEELLAEARALLERVPGLEMLADRAEELRRELDVMPEPDGVHHAGLTPAELRLLPLLATHLSFREIAQQLFVSRNTIKTQAISVYRKLGVSSRSEAVAEAQRLGLEEHLRVVVTSDRE
jgi:LuxR family transcriptional regulator, maltose regulon positive regulatory protein